MIVGLRELRWEGGVNGIHSGLELLRLFLRDVFSETVGRKFYPVKELECRHRHASFRPVGVPACLTGGTKDKGKAQGLVLSDFKKRLRKWLDERTVGDNPEAGLSDEDSEDGDDTIEMVTHLESGVESQLTTISSWDAQCFPSSQPIAGGNRKSTKARMVVITYLHHHSVTAQEFREAYKALTTSDAALLHLCGCGLASDTQPGCVEGSHLKLASLELNRSHTHVHFTLKLATSGPAYQAMLNAIRGSEGGVYDDVF